jgi:hypothetical protein
LRWGVAAPAAGGSFVMLMRAVEVNVFVEVMSCSFVGGPRLKAGHETPAASGARHAEQRRARRV